MSYTALFETNIGNRKKSRGVKQSGAKSWTITAAVPAKVTADFHTVKLVTDKVEAHKPTIVVRYLAKNTGNATGDVNVYVGKLRADGSVIHEDGWPVSVDPDVCVGMNAIAYDNKIEGYAPYRGGCDTIDVSWIKADLSAGTHYIGVRTWGADEKKPSYPKPTAAAPAAPMIPAAVGEKAPENWCTPAVGPIPEICLEPWQWGAVAAAGITAGVLTYAGVRVAMKKPIV